MAFVHVRVATITDLERVKKIRYDAFSMHAPSTYTPQEVRNLLGDLDEAELVAMIDDRQLLVAVDDGELRGVAGWRDKNLRHVYVAPGSERTGIGSHLVAVVEQDFRARTAETEIQVNSVLYARGFYEADGYEVASRDTAWDGSEFIKMTKTL
jgi:GNAT superfamily N-acetyltransferase